MCGKNPLAVVPVDGYRSLISFGELLKFHPELWVSNKFSLYCDTAKLQNYKINWKIEHFIKWPRWKVFHFFHKNKRISNSNYEMPIRAKWTYIIWKWIHEYNKEFRIINNFFQKKLKKDLKMINNSKKTLSKNIFLHYTKRA